MIPFLEMSRAGKSSSESGLVAAGHGAGKQVCFMGWGMLFRATEMLWNQIRCVIVWHASVSQLSDSRTVAHTRPLSMGSQATVDGVARP